MKSKSKLPNDTPIDLDDISDKPGHLIRLAHQKGVALFERAFSEFKLTVGQQLVMVALYKHPNLDLSSLAQLVTWDRSTTGDVVSRLSRRGLVTVTTSSEDLRVKLISISPSGRALLTKVAPAISRSQQEFLSALAPAERLELIRLMRKIVGRNSIQNDVPISQLGCNALAHQQVALSGSETVIGAVVQRRLSEQGAAVVMWPEAHPPLRNGIAKQSAASLSRPTAPLPDGCKLLIFCHEWPKRAEGDRSALTMDLTREFDMLDALLDQEARDYHVVVALSLMLDQAPCCMEMAAGLKRAFLYFARRQGAKNSNTKPRLAMVIAGSLQGSTAKNRRRSPSDLLAGLEDAADAVLFAAQPTRRSQTQIVIDQLPELG